jgi:hypothetical protein
MEFNDRRKNPDNPLDMHVEAARRWHANHFKVDPDFVQESLKPVEVPKEGEKEDPVIQKFLQDRDATHIVSFAHPDPETFRMRSTAWKLYANNPERPPAPANNGKNYFFAYNTEQE